MHLVTSKLRTPSYKSEFQGPSETAKAKIHLGITHPIESRPQPVGVGGVKSNSLNYVATSLYQWLVHLSSDHPVS